MSIWSVQQLNSYIKNMLDSDRPLQELKLTGEISNFKRHASSGHCYFSLKDDKASVNCVMFRSAALRLTFQPENGLGVVIQGSVSVYERSGNYQVYVDRMVQAGVGNLQIQFEQLKKKLASEGLFKSQGERRALPMIPSKIGIVTSPTGAVIRDMITVLRRRYPSVDVLLSPALVQGPSGATSIVAALDLLYMRDDIDLIIVARGGGSQEDLWNFNEEIVVRKIAESPVPIVSAVGHETDVTLADFAADLRAGTPSIAAEQTVPDRLKLLEDVFSRKRSLVQALEKNVKLARLTFQSSVKNSILMKPERLLERNRLYLDERTMALETVITQKMDAYRKMLNERESTLSALSPLAVLSRGYAIVETAEGRLVKSTADLALGERLSIYLSDGRLTTQIADIEQDGKDMSDGKK